MQRKNVFLGLALMMSSLGAAAQCSDYKWPQDQAKAEKYVDAFKTAIKDQNYKRATAGIQWMIANAPQWHSDLYVAAIETYDQLAEKELDPKTKENYIDSLFIIFDLRIKNCGDEENVLNRKAYSAKKYYNTNKAKYAESLAIFDKTFEVSGNNVLDNNLIGYFDAIRLNTQLKDDEIMQRYNKLMAVIDSKMKKAQQQNNSGDIAKYNKVLGYIDSKLPKMVKMDCEFVTKYFEPSFKANPSNLRLAKNIVEIVSQEKCPYDATWFEVAEALHQSSPDFLVSKELGIAYIASKNFDKGVPFITETQEKAKTPAEKVWVDILKGDLEFQKENKVGARDAYKKALITDPASKIAYERIGDLYTASTADCSKVQGSAEEKLVYIAAFQMYLKSGNREKMEQTLAKYPTAADLQKANWKTGEIKKLACWIDESVTIKAKKE